MIKEGEGKISDDAKKELESAIEEAKKSLTAETLEDLKAAAEKLQGVSHKIAGEMYQQQGGPEAGPQGAQPGAGEQQASSQKKMMMTLLTRILKKYNFKIILHGKI